MVTNSIQRFPDWAAAMGRPYELNLFTPNLSLNLHLE